MRTPLGHTEVIPNTSPAELEEAGSALGSPRQAGDHATGSDIDPNGDFQLEQIIHVRTQLISWLTLHGPLIVASLLLLAGYLHYVAGIEEADSATAYRDATFPAFRYSDNIWLYLRDNLGTQPRPYLDYRLEHPVLTGLLSYVLSFAPSLATYFALLYALLSLAVLGTIVALRKLPGTQPWWYAAAPALLLHPGAQMDPAAIGALALALVLYGHDRDRLGTLALSTAVWLKLFPLAFMPALLIERVRQRRYRSVVEILTIFTVISLAVNFPVARANWDGWVYFFEWNREREGGAGFWVLLDGLSTADFNLWSFVLVGAGWCMLAWFGLRLPSDRSLMLPLGASFLLWWLLANKIFTGHQMVWVFFAIALLRFPIWLWVALIGVDVGYHQIGSYVNNTIHTFGHIPLMLSAFEYLINPLHVARSSLLLVAVSLLLGHLATQPAREPVSWRIVGVRCLSASDRLLLRLLQSVRRGWTDTREGAYQDWQRLHPRSWTGLRRAITRDTSKLTLFPLRDSTVTRMRELLLRGAIVGGAYVLAVVLMTWPYAKRLNEATVIGPDSLTLIWVFRWVQHALRVDPLGLFNANTNYPFELTLAYTDANLPAALIGAPIYWLSGDPILTNSVLVLGTFLLAGASMYALVTYLTHNRIVAFMAGLAFAFLPYRYVHLWHLNQLGHAWTPLVLLALLRLIAHPTVGRAWLLGILIAVEALWSFYLFVQIAVVLVGFLTIMVSLNPEVRRWAFITRLTLGGLLAILLILPAYLPYLELRERLGIERSLVEAEIYKAQFSTYAAVPPWMDPFWPGTNRAVDLNADFAGHVGPDGHDHVELVVEGALFPGGVALVGAALGLALALMDWKRRRLLTLPLIVTGGLALILSLGPTLGPRDGSGAWLPYTWLYNHVTIFKAMRVPARFGVVVAFVIIVLAGLGAVWGWEWLSRRCRSGLRIPIGQGLQPRPGIIATVLCLTLSTLICAELRATPLPLVEIDRSARIAAPYEWLANQADDGPVMEFPADLPMGPPGATNARYHAALQAFWSTVHWHPIVAGNSGILPQPYLAILGASIADLVRSDGVISRDVSYVGDHNIALIEQLGIRYLVFHRDQYLPEEWPAVLAAVEGTGTVEKAGEFGEAAIYVVRNPHGQRNVSTTIYLPPDAAVQDYWSPAVVLRHTAPGPGLLELTRPTELTLTWYDAAGEEVYRVTRRLGPLTVMQAEWDLEVCVPEQCRWSESGVPIPLPGAFPSDPRLHPETPGRYTVKIEISGDLPAACTATVEIGTTPVPAGDEQWRLCIGDDTPSAPAYLPVNRPPPPDAAPPAAGS